MARADGWELCPRCAMPNPPEPEFDPGCLAGFVVGSVLTLWLMMALLSLAGK